MAHVGDSRCYLLREGRIYQVSEDHSLVNEQLKAGAISADEAKHSRFKNIITRSVGLRAAGPVVDLMGLELQGGDALVVCCDGLSNLVDDPEILSIVEESPHRARAGAARRPRERPGRRRQHHRDRRPRRGGVTRRPPGVPRARTRVGVGLS